MTSRQIMLGTLAARRRGEIAAPDIPVVGAYRYWRFKRTSGQNSRFRITQLELFATDNINEPIDIMSIGSWSDDKGSSSANLSKFFDYICGKYEHDIDAGSTSGEVNVIIDLGVGNAEAVGKIKIWPHDDSSYPDRAPTGFELAGSDDGMTWDTVLTVTGEPNWTTAEPRTYLANAIGNTAAEADHRFWRFRRTDGATNVWAMQEVELFDKDDLGTALGPVDASLWSNFYSTADTNLNNIYDGDGSHRHRPVELKLNNNGIFVIRQKYSRRALATFNGNYSAGGSTPRDISGVNILTQLDNVPATEQMQSNDGILSPNGDYILYMQSDSNLVMYYVPTNFPTWASNTSAYTDNGRMDLQFTDGNFVLYDGGGTARWSSGTGDADNGYMEINIGTSDTEAYVVSDFGDNPGNFPLLTLHPRTGVYRDRMPTSWVWEYSDNEVEWDTMMEISGDDAWTTDDPRTYNVSGLHRYWRLLVVDGITANVALAKVAFYQEVGGAPTNTNSAKLDDSGHAGTDTVDRVIDGDDDTWWFASGSENVWVSYDYDTPVDIVQYGVGTVSSGRQYGPAEVKLQYSDDNSNWSDADYQGGYTIDNWETSELKRWTVADGTTYSEPFDQHRIWRITFLANDGGPRVAMGEIEFRSTISAAKWNTEDANCAQSSTYSGEGPERAIDNTSTTWQHVNGVAHEWWQYDNGVSSPQALEEYVLQANSAAPNYSCTQWQIMYSDDGEFFETAFEVTGETGWSASEIRRYVVSDRTAHSISITNHDAEDGPSTGWTGSSLARYTHLGSWMFYGSSTASLNVYQDLDVTAHSAAIANGDVEAVLRWEQSSFDGQDHGYMSMEFFDSGMGSLGTVDTDSLVADQTKRTDRDVIGTVPIGTETIRIRMHGTRVGGSDLDAYFDEIELDLLY